MYLQCMTKIDNFNALIKAFDQDKAKVIADYADAVQDDLLTKSEFYKTMADFQKNFGDFKSESQKNFGDLKSESHKNFGDFKDGLNTKLYAALALYIATILGLFGTLFAIYNAIPKKS